MSPDDIVVIEIVVLDSARNVVSIDEPVVQSWRTLLAGAWAFDRFTFKELACALDSGNAKHDTIDRGYGKGFFSRTFRLPTERERRLVQLGIYVLRP